MRAADAAGEPVLILGGGSNLVVADEGFDGTVIQVATRGVSRGAGPGVLTVAAGEDWDAVVARTVAEGLAGLECLSGIPGLAGATPIQNVGAYGQEVAETITRVRVYDRKAGDVLEIPSEQCGFGYRTSRFRGADRFVVLSVTFGLAVQVRSVPVRYAELAAALGVSPGDQVESTEARSAVIELRQRKGMVIDPADPDTRSVGSFFVNPVLDAAALAAVEVAARARCGPDTRVPRFEAVRGRPGQGARGLADRAGRVRPGATARATASGSPSKHTLALVNAGSASTAALLALAREIRDGVRDTFGVSPRPRARPRRRHPLDAPPAQRHAPVAGRAVARAGRATGRCGCRLVEQVEGVGGVVDEVDGAVVRLDRQPEQGAGARRGTGAVQRADRDLEPERGDLHQVPVAAVDGQDVTARRHHQAERAVQVTAPGDGEAAAGAGDAEHARRGWPRSGSPPCRRRTGCRAGRARRRSGR